MGGRRRFFAFQQLGVLRAFLVLNFLAIECLSLNPEGWALLEFRLKVEFDPYGALENWNPQDSDPCGWSGVHCVDGKVEMLDLKELSLKGTLSPELGKLSHLKSLVLYKNDFFGAIPAEIGGLTMLEILDLRGNNLSGTIPTNLGEIQSLKCLLLSNNKFQGDTHSWIGKSNLFSDLNRDKSLTCDVATEIAFLNRKVRHCFWQSGLLQLRKANSLLVPLKGKFILFLEMFPSLKFTRESPDSYTDEHGQNLLADIIEPSVADDVHDLSIARRVLLQVASNLPAAPVSSSPPGEVVTVPSTGSGSFPAVPFSTSGDGNAKQSPAPPPNGSLIHPSSSVDNVLSSSKGWIKWIYIIVLPVIALIAIVASMFFMCRSHGVATMAPWKSGLSGQLQRAFVTGVPKLNRAELEAACEDFSNIIYTAQDYTVFKGILSSGVEIAVVSSAVPSTSNWSKCSDMCFRKKIDTISRVKHKNFINLLGYCEENEPFMRMMVFEYAPNGTLFEHLHVKEFEHLDWNARVRIIMGMAYCLQHMHHELNPPVTHPELHSSFVFITDDYAAKIAEMSIWREVVTKGKICGDAEMDSTRLHDTTENDVYNFGKIMLEIISGKLLDSEEHGPILSWASPYLNDKSRLSSLTDSTLKSVKDNEVEVICEVIQECVHQDPKKRPTMQDVTSKLREVINIPPEAATPRLSPLWWAELEILSVEAS